MSLLGHLASTPVCAAATEAKNHPWHPTPN